MATISVCMIVKNEEKILRRCLDSLNGIYEELVIVDTGSTDRTKEIAKEYTDLVYDFEWVGDFSKARNFAMSKATMEYIYMPDADEVLDEENLSKFIQLKNNLMPEIEIVQMWYVNQLANGTVYNYDRELRPKLYKRLREFVFIDPVHEMVRLDPVVFESDIEIMHCPENLHTSRDIDIFERCIKNGEALSDRLIRMYARELMVSGKEENFIFAKQFFGTIAESTEKQDLIKMAYIILAEAAAIENNAHELLKYSIKDIAGEGSSEICAILGAYYENYGELTEAAIWYYNARYEAEAEINIAYKFDIALKGLVRVYSKLGDIDTAKMYEDELNAQ